MADRHPANADMLEGYLDGFSDDRDEYPEASNRGASYAHGWRNGRDDRKGTPRASYSVLVTEAEIAMREDTRP